MNFGFYTTKMATEIRAVVLSDSQSILAIENVLQLPKTESYEIKNSLLKYLIGGNYNKSMEKLLLSIRLLLITFYDKFRTIQIEEKARS